MNMKYTPFINYFLIYTVNSKSYKPTFNTVSIAESNLKPFDTLLQMNYFRFISLRPLYRNLCFANIIAITMMMMMMNCFCGMVDRRNAFSFISICDHCQRSLPSGISNTPQAGFETALNPS